MSLLATSIIWQRSPNKGSVLLVELAIADFANDAGECWPAVPTLARKSRISDRQVQRVTQLLQDTSALTIARNGHQSGANKYTLNLTGYINASIKPISLGSVGEPATSAVINDQTPVTQTSTGTLHAVNLGLSGGDTMSPPEVEKCHPNNQNNQNIVDVDVEAVENARAREERERTEEIWKYLVVEWHVMRKEILQELSTGLAQIGWSKVLVETFYGKPIRENLSGLRNPTGVLIANLRERIDQGVK